MNRRRGFTLMELVVVIIIVISVAMIGVPVMRNSMKRAIVSEAVAGLRAIRTAQRAYHAKQGAYCASMPPGIRTGDLEGTYFSQDCYNIDTATDDTFVASCSTSGSTAPKADIVGRLLPVGQLKIDEDGDIVQSGLPGTEYPPE